MSNLMANVLEILGSNRARCELRLMAKALSLHPWLNDADDRLRLAAVRHALAHWPEYAAACQAKRDRRSRRA